MKLHTKVWRSLTAHEDSVLRQASRLDRRRQVDHLQRVVPRDGYPVGKTSKERTIVRLQSDLVYLSVDRHRSRYDSTSVGFAKDLMAEADAENG